MAGELDDMKGRVKEAVGDLNDDQEMKREGKADRLEGKAKDVVDTGRDKAEDAVESVRDGVRGDDR